MIKKRTVFGAGWKNTLYCKKRAHYFRSGRIRPLCNSPAVFVEGEPDSLPSGDICCVCARLIVDGKKNGKRLKEDE